MAFVRFIAPFNLIYANYARNLSKSFEIVIKTSTYYPAIVIKPIPLSLCAFSLDEAIN